MRAVIRDIMPPLKEGFKKEEFVKDLRLPSEGSGCFLPNMRVHLSLVCGALISWAQLEEVPSPLPLANSTTVAADKDDEIPIVRSDHTLVSFRIRSCGTGHCSGSRARLLLRRALRLASGKAGAASPIARAPFPKVALGALEWRVGAPG